VSRRYRETAQLPPSAQSSSDGPTRKGTARIYGCSFQRQRRSFVLLVCNQTDRHMWDLRWMDFDYERNSPFLYIHRGDSSYSENADTTVPVFVADIQIKIAPCDLLSKKIFEILDVQINFLLLFNDFIDSYRNRGHRRRRRSLYHSESSLCFYKEILSSIRKQEINLYGKCRFCPSF